MQGVIDIAVEGAKLIKELTEQEVAKQVQIFVLNILRKLQALKWITLC